MYINYRGQVLEINNEQVSALEFHSGNGHLPSRVIGIRYYKSTWGEHLIQLCSPKEDFEESWSLNTRPVVESSWTKEEKRGKGRAFQPEGVLYSRARSPGKSP